MSDFTVDSQGVITVTDPTPEPLNPEAFNARDALALVVAVIGWLSARFPDEQVAPEVAAIAQGITAVWNGE